MCRARQSRAQFLQRHTKEQQQGLCSCQLKPERAVHLQRIHTKVMPVSSVNINHSANRFPCSGLTPGVPCSARIVVEQLPLHCSTKLCEAPLPSAGTVTETDWFTKFGKAAVTWYAARSQGPAAQPQPNTLQGVPERHELVCSARACTQALAGGSPVKVAKPAGLGAPVDAIHSDGGGDRLLWGVERLAVLHALQLPMHKPPEASSRVLSGPVGQRSMCAKLRGSTSHAQ